MADYGIFRTNHTKRIAAATRRVEGTPQPLVRVGTRLANRWTPATEADTNTGLPEGGDCDCDHCLEGVTLPDVDPEAGVCCKGHPRRTIVQPWSGAEVQGELELKYVGEGLWATEPFDGDDCDGNRNSYRWLLTPSMDCCGSTIELELVTDNGCDVACAVYQQALPYKCLCTNSFDLVKWGNIDRGKLTCRVCDVPDPLRPDVSLEGTETCIDPPVSLEEIPATVLLTIAGADFDTSNGSAASCQCDGLPRDWSGFNDLEITASFSDVATISGSGLVSRITYSGTFEVGSDEWNIEVLYRYNDGFQSCGIQIRVYQEGCTFFTGATIAGLIPVDPAQTYNVLTTFFLQAPCVPAFTTGGGTITLSGGVTALGDNASPTSDGSCVGCTTETVIPTAYACCYAGECFEWDDALCTDFGGTFYADAGDCEEQCNPVGWCCLGNSIIDGIGEYECNLLGGIFSTTAAGCDQTGACCRSNGTCDSDVLPGDCTGPGETHYPGEDCTGKSCEGVCCCNGPETCCYTTMTYDECNSNPPSGEIYVCSETPTWIADGTCADCDGPAGC